MKLTLADVLDNLAAGEFNLNSIVDEATGEIPLEKVNRRLIPIINAGLADIHSKFFLKMKKIKVLICPGKTKYVLDKASSRTGMFNAGVSTIDDCGDPFYDDILEILAVKNSCDQKYRLNVNTTQAQPKAKGCRCGHGSKGCKCNNDCSDTSRYVGTLDYPATVTTYSPYGLNSNISPELQEVIMTPTPNSIEVPKSFKPGWLTVEYRATPRRMKKVEDDGLYDPAYIYIDLPYVYLNALIFYIASRITSPNMVGVNQSYSEGSNYYQKYISACAILVDQGQDIEQGQASEDRFTRHGFV